MSIMIRSVLLCRLTPHVLSCCRASCLLTGQTSHSLQARPHTPLQLSSHKPFIPKITSLAKYSDLSTQKNSLIYTLPHIKLLRALSRLKLLQTTITVVLLPPTYVLYFLGHATFFVVGYTTGIALFAGVMLYTISHFVRRVVGMMYLDPSQNTLTISHLTFWGKRHDFHLPVSDVMTIMDAGDVPNEVILKLRRYSTPKTMYFSTYFGQVVDKQGFERVFGKL